MQERRGATVLDEDDLRLVDALQIAPRATWQQLGQVLRTSPSAAAQRWQRLVDRGQAWTTAYPLGTRREELLAFLFVRCRHSQMTQVIEDLVGRQEVVSLEVLDGMGELLVTARADDYSTMTELTLPAMRTLSGISGMTVNLCTSLHSSGVDWRIGALTATEAARLQAMDQTRATTQSNAELSIPRAAARVLARNGRATAADLARAMGVHPSTGQRWLTRILEAQLLVFRCDVSHRAAGFPLVVVWRMRLPAAEHAGVGLEIAGMPQVRLCASTTGGFNLIVTMWLASAGDIFVAEQRMSALSPALEIVSSSVCTQLAKRVGRSVAATGSAVIAQPENPAQTAAW